MTGGCGSTIFLGEAGGSVALWTANSGTPTARKSIPTMRPAAGAIDVAQAVAIIGPVIKTNSSLSASSE